MDYTSFRFTTDSLPVEQRFAIWQEAYSRAMSRRILAPLSAEPPRVDAVVRAIGCVPDHSWGVRVMRMTFTTGTSVTRTPELLADGNDDVVLHIPESGRRIVSQLGREATVSDGVCLLTSNADASTIAVPGPARFLSIEVPRKAMAAVSSCEDSFMRPLPADSAVPLLLMRYLDILDDARALETPELRRAVATHVQDLCALAIGASRDAVETARGRGLRAARLHAVKADVLQNLEDAGLSASALALRQRVTPRYIHKLFESEGTTLSQFILMQRLARAHRMLLDASCAHLQIGEIAYRVGFGDLSTFNHAFRRRFDATPTEVRKSREN
jgi:AraC-like DNA-binding protein